MMIIMMVAGIAALLAGALAILFGIPVKEFSFGNTLILSGAVAACTGMVLLALSAVVAELKLIARRLATDSRSAAADARVRGLLPPVGSGVAQPAGAGEGGFLFGRDQAAIEHAGGAAPPTAWQEETASRTWQETAVEPQDELTPASATKPRRNLMFSSSMRRDRERAQVRLGNPAASDSRAQEEAAEPGEAPPANFDDAWPKTERARPGEIPPQRRSGRQSSPPPPDGGSGAADRAAPAPPERSEEQPLVTVLKSGVVDGMAYSLYSDGSIEAQMPEGLMRFASLDELTAHIERRL